MSRKRSREAMEKLRDGFMEGAQKNGIDEKTANMAFAGIASFAEFGFCKAHAAALAETTYRSAWLKLYYPGEYFCALLNCQPMGFYSPEVIVNHARHNGIAILPVDINRSRARCTMEQGKIRLGLRYVKAVGEKTWQKIEDERGQGLYASLSDFYARTRLEREAMENLILVGAFDFLGVPRRQLLWQLRTLARQPKQAIPLNLPTVQVPLPGMTLEDELAADYQIQGLSARHHPMEVFRSEVSKDKVVKSSDIAAIPSGTKVRVAGCVVCRQAPGTAKGHVFVTLEDEHGLMNVILRPSVYEKYRQVARLEPIIVVEGILQKNDGVVNVVAERLHPIRHSHDHPDPTSPTPIAKVRNFA